MNRGQPGMALIVVLVILVAVSGTSASLIWFMNQQQTRAGAHLRAAAASAAAEAGVHRALSILESVAPDNRTPGRTWRPAAYSETLRVGPLEGRYTISLADGPGGAILINSAGEVAETTRRLRARVYLASPALLAGLHGASVVRFEQPPAAAVILPYGAGIGDRPWIHVAAGRSIWFVTTNVSINNPEWVPESAPGPVDAPAGAGSATGRLRPGPVRLLLARGADLTLGQERQSVDVLQLRVMGVYIDGVVLRAEALPSLPVVDRTYYRSQAEANTRNASLNEAAGRFIGDHMLQRKRDSLYSEREFEDLQGYIKSGPAPPQMTGMIYVTGGVSLLEGERLHIADGALVAESTVHISQGAVLEITHTATTRTLPGLIVLGNGGLYVTQEARLRVHGLVYAGRTIDVNKGARVDVVGAVLGNDGDLAFQNTAGIVVIRYDPAVMGTPGLHVAEGDPVVAWVAAWEELP